MTKKNEPVIQAQQNFQNQNNTNIDYIQQNITNNYNINSYFLVLVAFFLLLLFGKV